MATTNIKSSKLVTILPHLGLIIVYMGVLLAMYLVQKDRMQLISKSV